MNEADLRDRWLTALTASEPYRAAQLAVEVDKAKRAAKFAKAMKGTGAEERAVLMQKQRDEEGSGAGEIQLAAMQNAHKAEVDRYIATATKDHAAQMSRSDPVATRYSAEPDFTTHAPYIEPGYFHVGGGEPTGAHAQALKAATKGSSGKNFTPSADPALDHATQQMVEQQKVAAAVENARKVRLQEIQANRPRDRINVNDFRFNRGGTIETGGRTFTVEPGIGRQPMTTPELSRDAGSVDDFGRMRGTGVMVASPEVDQTKAPAVLRSQARPLIF